MNRLIVWEKEADGFETVFLVQESRGRKVLEATGRWYQENRKGCRYVIEKMGKPILPGGVR